MNLIPSERIESKIYLIRGRKVMVDRDIAELYGVKTKALIQAVKRNQERFPSEFMFILNKAEAESLRSQIVTLEKGRGRYSKYLPHAFTEHGVLMLSSVLNSKRAIQVNIEIIRVFIRLNEYRITNEDIVKRLDELQQKTAYHDYRFEEIFDTIKQLIAVPGGKEIKVKGFAGALLGTKLMTR